MRLGFNKLFFCVTSKPQMSSSSDDGSCSSESSYESSSSFTSVPSEMNVPTRHEPSVPDDALVIQYPSVDPTQVLENSEVNYVNQVCDEKVDEKMGSMLVALLDQYRKLAMSSFEINTQIIKYRLNHEDLKQRDVVALLDKFYRDFPSVSPLPGAFIDADHLQLLGDKLNLHLECEQMLKSFATVMEKTAASVKKQKHKDCESDEDDDDSNDSQPSEPPSKEKKQVKEPSQEQEPAKANKKKGGKKKN